MYLQVVAWFAQGRVLRDPVGRVRVQGAQYIQSDVVPNVETAVMKAVLELENNG
jgi:hypothetical protein